MGIEWLKHFDVVTKPCVSATSPYRLLIINGYDSHITLEFVKYCDEVNIKPYCLPPHSTHLLQPLDVGLFSPLRKVYGKGVDNMTLILILFNLARQFPTLVPARITTYTHANIMVGWQGAGLIPFNP